MGDFEVGTLVSMESHLGYHPMYIGFLTCYHESGRGTVSDGQFDWGGRLLNGNGGVQRFPLNG